MAVEQYVDFKKLQRWFYNNSKLDLDRPFKCKLAHGLIPPIPTREILFLVIYFDGICCVFYEYFDGEFSMSTLLSIC